LLVRSAPLLRSAQKYGPALTNAGPLESRRSNPAAFFYGANRLLCPLAAGREKQASSLCFSSL
jgi:hypothetical protein